MLSYKICILVTILTSSSTEDKPNTFRSSSTRQRKRKFARLGQPYRLVESLAFSLTKISISNTDDTRERIEVEFVNKNPPPQRYLRPLFPDSFQSRTTLWRDFIFSPLKKILIDVRQTEESRLNLDVESPLRNNYPGDIFHQL